jgi:CBS domain containing-hemolysin-like protein
MDFLFDPATLAGLGTLIVLEVVLGIDNLVFIAILADKLPPHQRDKARLIGLSLALVMRLALLASIAWIIGLTAPVFSIAGWDFSWRDIILVGGGLFLIVKATIEIHERLEGETSHGGSGQVHAAFWVVIAQILALDAVFSLDSIITAVGMVDELWVMVTAVIVAMAIMMISSKPLTAFVGRHPTVVILCLSFLLLIGFSLVAEGFGYKMPKGYLYAAIGFSIIIETFNQMMTRNKRKAQERTPMRERTANSIYRLLTGGDVVATAPAAGEAKDALPQAAFRPSEQAMIRGVIELADQPVRAIMTPRGDVFWLDANDGLAVNRDRLIRSGRTRVLVCRGSLDDIAGVIEARAVLPAMFTDEAVDLAALAERPLVVPDSITALRLIDVLRETGERFAVVVDADGNVDGVVTSTDIFAAIAGDLADDEDHAGIEKRDESPFEVDARTTLRELADSVGGNDLAATGRYTTVAGFLLFEFGRMPNEGEAIERGGLSFTVKSSLPNRIDRVIVRNLKLADAEGLTPTAR